MDIGFVITETATSPKHVAGLLLFELPADMPAAGVAEMVAQLRKQPVHAPFDQILKFAPPALPCWTTARQVDTEYHIRHTRLPSPGSEAQLLELTGKLHAPLLDRSRPLWEMHVIEGLEGHRMALYFKVHHAYADGVTFSRWLVDSMSTSDSEIDTLPLWARVRRSAQAPSTLSNPAELLRQLGRHALTAAELATMTLRHGLQLAGAYDSRVPVPFSAPRTPFNGISSRDRSIATQNLDLEEVRQLGNRLGASINDVILTLCDMALRQYLGEHHAQTSKPLVAEMPVNLRRDGISEKTGNQISILLVEMGDPAADPLHRLKQIHDSSRRVQRQFSALAEETVTTYSLSTQIIAQVGEALGLNEQAPPLGNVVVSNLPGPQQAVFFRGARLSSVYPISVLAPNVAINITVYSYAGTLCIGLVAARRQIPDLGSLAERIGKAFSALKKAARDKREAG
jgi:WS/DGAT/MGAT family acyltransferase